MMQTDIERWWDESPRAALLLLAGATIGPHGLRLLREGTLDLLSPAVPVALAAIGVLLASEQRWRSVLAQAVAIGAAAAVAVAFEDELPHLSAITTITRVLLTCAAAAVIGATGVLLLSPAQTSAERRVLGLGLLLVIGGSANVLGALAVPAGAIAAAIWTRIAPVSAQAMRPDIEYVGRALIALLMVIAGAAVTVSLPALIATIVYTTVVVLAGRPLRLTRTMSATAALALAADVSGLIAPGAVALGSGVAIAVVLTQLWEVARGSDASLPESERLQA